MTDITTFKVTVQGGDGWCDPGAADALADLITAALEPAVQRVADLAPTMPAGGGPVRVLVIEDLGPGPLMRNFRALAVSPEAPSMCLEHDRPAFECTRLALADYGQPFFDNCDFLEPHETRELAGVGS